MPLIKTNCIDGETLYPSIDNKFFVDQETYENWFRGHPEPGDIILTLKGTPGRTALVPQKVNFCIAQDMVAIRADRTLVHPSFLLPLIRSRQVQHEIESLSVGTTIPHFKKTSFKDLVVSIPSIELQESIGGIYMDFCFKIDLLKRQNKTLEGMAEALFRQWFIEEAQDGWEEVSIDQVGTFLNGLACQKHRPTTHGSLPVLKIRDLRNGLNEDSDRACANVDPKYIVEAGDLIFSWSGTLEVKIWDGARCVLNQHLFKVTSEDFPRWYLLLWCQHHLAQWRATAEAHATTMGHIKRSDLKAAMVLVPSDYELGKMDEKMEGIMARIDLNNAEINSLVKQRDTLLPKLMSGEVRVQMD